MSVMQTYPNESSAGHTQATQVLSVKETADLELTERFFAGDESALRDIYERWSSLV
ncbi:MAG: hypothetical protein HOI16_00195, partial [Actinobacteria bacterium]|nr:hypothetical protein [Actinomycetota bacterium]